MRFTFATVLALTALAFTTTALGNLPPPTGPVPVHSPAHFWLTATFTATPSDYGGRCGTGFYIDFKGVITGSPGAHIGYMFQYGGTQTNPVYVTLDIDCVDPAFAPGTGTPQVGGFSSAQIMELVRGLRGLKIVGCDLVEVSPPYDNGSITSLLAANLLYELLCVL